MLPRTARYTLFPYTTLFRSSGKTNMLFEPFRILRLYRICLVYRSEFLLYVFENICYCRGAHGAVSGDISMTGLYIKFRSEEHTSELQSRENLVCRLLLEKQN